MIRDSTLKSASAICSGQHGIVQHKPREDCFAAVILRSSKIRTRRYPIDIEDDSVFESRQRLLVGR